MLDGICLTVTVKISPAVNKRVTESMFQITEKWKDTLTNEAPQSLIDCTSSDAATSWFCLASLSEASLTLLKGELREDGCRV